MVRRAAIRSAFKAKVLDLQGSVARDHLANERTFLAWIRTGFATAALGIVLARLQVTNAAGTPLPSEADAMFYKILSLVFVIIGAICLVAGSYRYALVEYSMERGQYPTSGLVSVIVAFLGIVAFLATFIMLLI